MQGILKKQLAYCIDMREKIKKAYYHLFILLLVAATINIVHYSRYPNI